MEADRDHASTLIRRVDSVIAGGGPTLRESNSTRPQELACLAGIDGVARYEGARIAVAWSNYFSSADLE